MGVSEIPDTRVSQVASESRYQPATIKCPHATETDVAPSRAATRLLALPPTLAHAHVGVPAAPPRSSPRGARVELEVDTAYPLSCAARAHRRTILKVVRISRPLDALDFVNRIHNCQQTINRRSTDDRAQCRETAPCRRPRACKTNGSTCTGAVKLELRGRR